MAFWSGLLSPIINYQLNNDVNFKNKNLSAEKKYQYELIALIAFGFGEVIGALIMGFTIDKIGS